MNDFNENARNVKNKANELYDTAKEKASEAYYGTKPKAEELAAEVKQTTADLYESGKERIDNAQDCVEEYVASMAHSIRKQPVTSVLFAAGIGYLFAKLFKK